jgi:methionyl-tRNA synthetase
LLDLMGVSAKAREYEALQDVNWYLSLARSDFRLPAPKPLFPKLELEDEEAAA